MKKLKKKARNNLRRMVSFFIFTLVVASGFPGYPASAAPNGFSFEGFRLTAPAAYVNGDQQEGAGDFANGNAANAGQYAEGMCVPVYIEVTNTSGGTLDYDAEVEFGHYRSQEDVIGYERLEVVTTALSDVSTADNLNDFSTTGNDLTGLTSATTLEGSSVNVLVEGPFNDSDDPLTDTDDEGYYRITATAVPDGETLQIVFCGRLSDQAGQYGQGSNLHIGMTQGGGQIPSSPDDFLELPELTVIKQVVNDDGTIDPALSAGDFTLNVDNNGTVTPVTGSETGVVLTLQPGTFSVTEADAQGYTASYANCSGDLVLANPANTATCTVTNDDPGIVAPATADLTITKVITGTNVPADATPDDFSFLGVVDGGSLAVTPFEADGDVVISAVPVGAVFSIFEAGVSMDWDVTYDGCIGMMDADGANCVITNTYDRVTGSVTIEKVIINDDGGTETIDNFDFYLDASVVEEGVPVTGILQDNYSINEVWNSNHDAQFPDATATNVSDWYDIQVECIATNSNSGLVTVLPVDELNENFDLTPADDIVCTITNDDIATPPATGALTVTKIVINDDGGTAVVSDFPLYVDGTSVASGVSNEFEVGTYTVSEDNSGGYTGTFSGDCDANGSVTIADGDDLECVITNDDTTSTPPVDPLPTLTVTKIVINDDGGTAVVSDFNLYVDGVAVSSGVSNEFSPGTYTVTEDNLAGYDGVFSGDCDANGDVTLEMGDELECILTNNDIAIGQNILSFLTLHLQIINDDGGSFFNEQFTLFANGEEFEADEAYEVEPGEYQVAEIYDANALSIAAVADGYTTSFSDDCDSTGMVVVNQGDDLDCTVVINDVADTNGGSNGGGGSSGGGSVPARQPSAPTPQVLGETDEVPVEEIPTVTEEPAPAPVPQVLGETDELPRTGLPFGALALTSFLVVVLSILCVRLDRKNSRGV